MNFASHDKFTFILIIIGTIIGLSLIIPGAIMCSRITYCSVPAIFDEADNYYCGFQCCPDYECSRKTFVPPKSNSGTCLMGNETTTHCCHFYQDAVGYNVCVWATTFGIAVMLTTIILFLYLLSCYLRSLRESRNYTNIQLPNVDT